MEKVDDAQESLISKIETAIRFVDVNEALKALAEVERKIRADNSSSGPLPDFKPMNAVA